MKLEAVNTRLNPTIEGFPSKEVSLIAPIAYIGDVIMSNLKIAHLVPQHNPPSYPSCSFSFL